MRRNVRFSAAEPAASASASLGALMTTEPSQTQIASFRKDLRNLAIIAHVESGGGEPCGDWLQMTLETPSSGRRDTPVKLR